MTVPLFTPKERFSYLINPVTIQQRRGWLVFRFGGYAVFEEVFVSSDFGEWLLLHWNADRLYEVYCHSSVPPMESVRRLFWMYQDAVDAELRRRSIAFPRSPDEVYDIIHSLPDLAGSLSYEHTEQYDERLRQKYQDLVVRRFSHIR